MKNAPLLKVLNAIAKQTDYVFAYEESVIQKANKVNIVVTNSSLAVVLDICFKDQPLTYEIDDKIIMIREKKGNTLMSNTQNKDYTSEIKGRVINENGDPIPQVTVTIKGTKTSTITDANGEFKFPAVDTDAALVFTHVSMETFELKIQGKSNLLVRLKAKISELGDVTITISTGYQEIPKERATGSFVKVDNKMINQQTGTNILNRLDGITSGVYFNVGKANNNLQSNTNILIRGLSTINGPLDPLVVLDNFIYEGDIANINPNDIESISVLKDAAATSIYGPRGGNGVIVITTKKGEFNQRLKINVNTNVIVSKEPDLLDLPQMSSSDYIFVEEFLFNKGFFNSTINNTTTRPPITPAVEIFLKRRNGFISASDSANQIDALKNIDSRDEYKKHFYQDAITQQYSLNISGGSANIAWLVSGAFDKEAFTLKNNKKKANIRIENIYKPTKSLRINFGVYYTNSKAIVTGAPAYNSIHIGSRRSIPYLTFADENGNALPINKDYSKIYSDTAGAGKILDWKYYPLNDYKHDVSTARVEEIIANVGANIQIFKSLQFNINYQYQRQKNTFERLSDIESYNARNLINRFSQVDWNTGIVNYIVPKGDILTLSNSSRSSQNIRAQFNLSHTWAEHDINAIAGIEAREIISDGESNTFYGYIDDPLSFGNVDFQNRYPILPRGTSFVPGSPILSPTKNNRFVNGYLNSTYGYKQRYYFSLSARKDGSNIYGVTTNEKWKPLWSTGVAWEISKEPFYKVSWLPQIKVRATYGYSGNVDLNKAALPVAQFSTSPISDYPYARINTLNNPSLRWEKVRQVNIGIDFSTLNRKVSGVIEYYWKKGEDLYGLTFYDYTAWGLSSTITKNVASMEGRGVDISLQIKNIEKQIKWTTVLLFNYNMSKTTSYFTSEANNIASLLASGNTINPVIGKPLYAIVSYKWAGLDSLGNPQGYLNGQPSKDYSAIANQAGEKGLESGSITYSGPTNPTLFGSVMNLFSWRKLSISFNFVYKFGYYFRKPSLSYASLISSGIGHREFSERWKKPGDELLTNVPSFVYPNVSGRDNFYSFSEINVLKGDHIKLQFVNFAYALNSAKLKHVFDEIQIYANASNIGIVWRANKYDLDPDYPEAIPPLKSYTIGLRANF